LLYSVTSTSNKASQCVILSFLIILVPRSVHVLPSALNSTDLLTREPGSSKETSATSEGNDTEEEGPSKYCKRYSILCTTTPHITWCSRKVMRLTTLCTNRQRCCLPLHVAVRLTPAVDSVQVWTCYSCYAIVKSVWSDVVCEVCYENGPAKVSATFCHQILCETWWIHLLWLMKVYKGLMENIPYPGHKCSDDKSFLEGWEKVEDKLQQGNGPEVMTTKQTIADHWTSLPDYSTTWAVQDIEL
jgi:hypothetical protein